MNTTIRWDGTFDAAHFIPGHPKCGRLHGHTYAVRILIEAAIAHGKRPHYLVDYGAIKNAVNLLDHKLITPVSHVSVSERHGTQVHAVDWWNEDGATTVVLPQDATYVLPQADSSAECLAAHLLETMCALVEKEYGIQPVSIVVSVSETPKTEATASWTATQQ